MWQYCVSPQFIIIIIRSVSVDKIISASNVSIVLKWNRRGARCLLLRILVVSFFGRVKWVEQLIPVARNCALRQRENMCRLSAFVRHKFKSLSVNINGKFGVEWHRDFNKDFTQIYCVVEWCVMLSVTWLDIGVTHMLLTTYVINAILSSSHADNAWHTTNNSHIGLSSFLRYFFRRLGEIACSTWWFPWH